MIKDFKDFAVKGNVIDMAVGIIVGAAFTTVVKSLVDDLLMPPLGVILGNVDFSDKFLLLRDGTPAPPYVSVDQAKKAGATVLSYGQFINAVVSFLIVAFVLFLVVRWITKLRGQAPRRADHQELPVLPVDDRARRDALPAVHVPARSQARSRVNFQAASSSGFPAPEAVRHLTKQAEHVRVSVVRVPAARIR